MFLIISFQNEPKQQQLAQAQAQAQTHSSSSGSPAWGGIFQHSTPSPQSSSVFWGDNQVTKPSATSGSKPSYVFYLKFIKYIEILFL